MTNLKRRVQHYGYKYEYKNKAVDPSYYLGEMPKWLQYLCDKLHHEGFFSTRPDQVIVNEYMPGQGIAPHIDCIPCFADTICSLSLGSQCVMGFISSENPIKEEILLLPRSLLLVRGEARYKWQHGIAARKNDKYKGILYQRHRRISLTFRKVVNV